jgi:hypothetical protein
MGKNTVKGATQMSRHSLKLNFCMFERSQVKHNNLDCQKKIGIFFINYKDYMLKSWHKSKKINSCSKHSNLENGLFLFFSNILYSTQYAPFFLKIREDFNIDN